MKRHEAIRRHRRFVIALAAALGLIIVLLALVAPRVENVLADFGHETPEITSTLLAVSRWLRSRLFLVAALAVTLVGLAWNALPFLERQAPSKS